MLPVGAAAAYAPPPPSHQEAHPWVMQQAAAQVATVAPANTAPPRTTAIQPRLMSTTTSSAPTREIFGFGLASSLNDPTYGYPSWNFSLLSTVAFFGLHVNDDGTLAADAGWNVWNSSQLTGLVNTAHASGTKVVLTVIEQDFSPGTPHMCSALAHLATTISATVAEMKAKGVDGVNVDYEGLNGSCGSADPSYARHAFSQVIVNFRLNMPAGSYLSVDTYASSAADPLGFFDVPALAANTDSFFVMAYDLEYSNYSRAPAACPGFCLGPTAPLTGYYYNDTDTAKQYLAVVPASKVILGVPYYGRKACVGSVAPNQTPNPSSSVVADTYLDATGESTAPMVQAGSYATHRDANDPAGQERWDTWVNTSLNCTRELYWDDTVSLAQKYALVNQDNLRGVGIWNLNYGGGAPELWATLNTAFACPVSMQVSNPTNSNEFTVLASAGSCGASSFDIQGIDITLNLGNVSWFQLKASPPANGSSTAVVDGFPGHTFVFQARVRTIYGTTGSWAQVTTTLAPNASLKYGFTGLYMLDAYGGVHGENSEQLPGNGYWPGYRIARAIHALNPQSGAVVDGFGGLHPYGVPVTLTGAPYWPGFDIVRDFAFLPDGSGGYVLDGFGGLHPFSVNGHAAPPAATGASYWPGSDVARKLVIFSDGTGGYMLDKFGGLHPFGIGGPTPGLATGAPYWPGFAIARDVVLIPGTHAGYVLDGFGGVHPFSGAPAVGSGVYWRGFDIARSIWLSSGSTITQTSGYVLDGFGGVHPFGGAPALSIYPYWSGQDIALNLSGS